MAIRWVSTHESIKANQPSVLATVETLAAMAVSIWIAVTWDTYIHIAIGASIAPLLLMRTDESCIKCVDLTRKLCRPFQLMTANENKLSGLWLVLIELAWPLLYWLCAPTLFLLARIAAWLASVARHPMAAFNAIPANWHYSTIVLDSKKWPDVLPEPRMVSLDFDASYCFHVGNMMQDIRYTPVNFKYAILWLLNIALLPFFIVSAFAYRWSLKSTAIIWFPLLWGMRSVRKAGKSFQEYLSSYVRSPISVLVVCISISIIVMFLAKVILLNEWAGFVDWWNATPLRRILSLYVSPQEIQVWQLAMLINSIVAIIMYLLAVQWLVWKKYKQLTNENLLSNVFKVGLFIRPIFTGYTISCTLYITIRVAFDLQWPALGTKFFPWM